MGEEDPANKSFFSEIISSISDIKFSSDGRFILSRDYLTLKIWDIRQEGRPLKVLPIHDHLRAKLCDLYENDSIFDKFECCFSGDGKHCLPARTTTRSTASITRATRCRSRPTKTSARSRPLARHAVVNVQSTWTPSTSLARSCTSPGIHVIALLQSPPTTICSPTALLRSRRFGWHLFFLCALFFCAVLQCEKCFPSPVLRFVPLSFCVCFRPSAIWLCGKILSFCSHLVCVLLFPSLRPSPFSLSLSLSLASSLS